MTPVAYTIPARPLPCNGERYRPTELAAKLEVTPRCLWCREFIVEGGECLGFLEPEKAGEL